ncbi:MAG: Stp1/IreP family PP2C-type Ser/Thr phosphatase [Deltaproteobacteria bacterium]|nr:Stp1/IreP family PP2C-type Ser/Thr phosphatase [Deltaproteobacteria bacterium]
MEIVTSGLTDVGLKREGNEDSYSLDDSLHLYIVADGMGGHLAGEVASQIAVDMINKSFRKWAEKETPEDDLFGFPDSTVSTRGNYIISSIRLANRVIYEMAMEYEQYHGMGTTVVALLVTPSRVIAANVGDSRIYLVRDGHIERLSKDHTIVAEQVEMGMMTEEEAATSPLKHILTRNLGSSEDVEPEIFELEPANNDRYLLCSDGLTDLVNDGEILEMLQNEDDPNRLCHRLVDKVLKRGAHDNTTLVSVYLSGLERPRAGIISKIGLALADLVVSLQKLIRKFKP